MPGTDENTIRRVLLANQSSLVYAIDRDRGVSEQDQAVSRPIATASESTSSAILIDREGKIAIPDRGPELRAEGPGDHEGGRDRSGPKRMTEGQSSCCSRSCTRSTSRIS